MQKNYIRCNQKLAKSVIHKVTFDSSEPLEFIKPSFHTIATMEIITMEIYL